MRFPKRQSGFTLIEVVVVITNIALLSAILVPLVGRQIEEAKTARAKNECQIIAATILRFYGDVGNYPAKTVSTNPQIIVNMIGLKRLVSGTALETINSSSSGLTYGYTSATNDNWYDAGQGFVLTIPSSFDVFNNHLNVNSPKGDASYAYDTTGEAPWKGPYLPSVGDDPWGHHYVCNINAAYGGTGAGKLCVVISAGPNGYFDSTVDPDLVTDLSGDDIYSIVLQRP